MENTELMCERCNGSGRIKLMGHLESLYRLIRERPGLRSSDLRALVDPNASASAFAHRLKKLQEFGLIMGEEVAQKTGGIEREWHSRI